MRNTEKAQAKKFEKAAREVGADMSKEEFGRVIGKIAKPEPQVSDSESDKDKTARE